MKLRSIVRTTLVIAVAMFASLYLVAMSGCSETDEESTPVVEEGSLFVRVVSAQHQPVGGVTVLTSPRTMTGVTDGLGVALLEDIPIGTYQVIATLSGYGSGTVGAVVVGGQVVNADIELVPGSYLEPRVNITTPSSGQVFSYVDTVVVSASVTLFTGSGENVHVTFASNLDGLLHDTTIHLSGNVRLETADLQNGDHWIKLQAINDDSFFSRDSVQISVQSFDPTINISQPTETEFSPGEAILFQAHADDHESAPANLLVTWSSDLDGIFFTGTPSANGTTEFEFASLSRAVHVVTVRVVDQDQLDAADSIRIYNVLPRGVVLDPPLASQSGVALHWSLSSEPDFEHYLIYRSDEPQQGRSGELLATISSPDIVAFTDSTPPFVPVAYYSVFVEISSGYFAGSNEVSIAYPAGTILNIRPTDVLVHPVNRWVYLYDNGGLIICYDLDSLDERSRTTLSGGVGWMDIADNGFGTELYVPMDTEGWVSILDAESFTQVASLNTGDPCQCAVTDGNGNIYADVRPGTWWDWPVRSYNRATLSPIDSADFTNTIFGGRLRLSRTTGELIEISTWVSPIDADYFTVNESGHFTSGVDDPYHGDHALSANIFRLSPDGDFWVSSVRGAVYRLTSALTYEGTLPIGSDSFTDFAISDDGTLIYGSVEDRPVIKVYSYPSLLPQTEIALRAPAVLLAKQEGRLVAVLGVTNYQSAIEVIEL